MSIAEGTIIKMAQNILLPDDQVAVNVYWAEVEDAVGSGPLDDADVLEAAANYMDEIYTNLLAFIANTATGTLVEVWTVDPVDGDLTPVGDELTTWTAAGATDALPNGCAAIISAKTVNTEVTGRKFFPSFIESNAVDNNWLSGAVTAMLASAADWILGWEDANDVNLIAGVWSMTKLDFYTMSGTIIANAIVGYQRRRKPGVGT